jgi:uncharacterized C2H2 Zn-finger protein
MDITPNTRTVTEYHLTLSSDEALACIDKPWDFGEALAEKLRAAGLGAPANGNGNGNGHQKNRLHLTLGAKRASRTPVKGRGQAAARKTKAARKAPKAGRPMLQCPHCDRTFKHQARLNTHVAKAHTPAAEAPTWSPAPAAE